MKTPTRKSGSDKTQREASSQGALRPVRRATHPAKTRPRRSRAQRKTRATAPSINQADNALKAPHVVAPSPMRAASRSGYAGGYLL